MSAAPASSRIASRLLVGAIVMVGAAYTAAAAWVPLRHRLELPLFEAGAGAAVESAEIRALLNAATGVGRCFQSGMALGVVDADGPRPRVRCRQGVIVEAKVFACAMTGRCMAFRLEP